MIAYVLVGIGGASGSIVRYFLGKKVAEKTKRIFPLGTVIINISGAFLLGFVSNIHLGSNMLLLLADGFLGAYTTFSTFMYEGFNIFHDKKYLDTAVYIGGTLLFGLVFYVIGQFIAKTLF